MHLNALYIERFVNENKDHLQGSVLVEAYSLSKTEAYFVFRDKGGEIFLWRIQFDAQSVFLSFPVPANAPVKSRLDLFKELHGTVIGKMAFHAGERSFHLQATNGIYLLFKLHGRNGNVIQVSQEQALPFRREISNDTSYTFDVIDTLASEPPTDTHTPNLSLPWVKGVFSRQLSIGEPITAKDWNEATERFLYGKLHIVREGDKYSLVSGPHDHSIHEYSGMAEAWNDYARLVVSSYHFHRKKTEKLALLNARLKQSNKLLGDWKKRILDIEENRNYRHWGDLVMSNLYLFQPGSNEIEVYDYLHEKNIRIPLNPEKSGQENAERYYRKAKKQNMEAGFLQKQVEEQQKKTQEIQEQILVIEATGDYRSLKPFLEARKEKKKEVRVPYREFEFMGYKVLVGKSSSDNDELSFKIAKKDDLWLHARDVSGSHVIIRNQAGKAFPQPVIEFAARLAAWYSKRKQDSLCPVMYTERKYVRKRKGDAPGKVVVDKEQTLLVTPELPSV